MFLVSLLIYRYISTVCVQEILRIFKNGHIAADQAYFYKFNSKKIASLAEGACGVRKAKFSFSIKRTVKKFAITSSFYLKEQAPKIKLTIKQIVRFSKRAK